MMEAAHDPILALQAFVQECLKGKVCPACREWKGLAQYNRARRAGDGRQTECRECHAARNRAYQARPEVKARRAANRPEEEANRRRRVAALTDAERDEFRALQRRQRSTPKNKARRALYDARRRVREATDERVREKWRQRIADIEAMLKRMEG